MRLLQVDNFIFNLQSYVVGLYEIKACNGQTQVYYMLTLFKS